MKKCIVAISLIAGLHLSLGQELIPLKGDSRVITTGVPFMLVSPEARGSSIGEQGVATRVDAFSGHWNAAKFAFAENRAGVGISYTPYLKKLVNDISLSYLSGYNRLNDFSAISASIKYFSLGEIVLTQDANDVGTSVKPSEFVIEGAYSLRLSERFAMGVGLKYFNSALRLGNVDSNARPGSSFGVDITGYYQSEEVFYSDFDGRWSLGFAIQNLGPKFKYDDGGEDVFQPSNLRLGGGFQFLFDEYNSLQLSLEFSKYLVPTPPVYGYSDLDGDQEQDLNEPTIIIEGKDNDVSFLTGVFQSFGDAPGGFSEEIKEFTWSLGAEYLFQDSFALRAGYFNESEIKGARKFFNLGAGFNLSIINIDLSYLISASKVQSPLENTLRFSLSFNIDKGSFLEL